MEDAVKEKKTVADHLLLLTFLQRNLLAKYTQKLTHIHYNLLVQPMKDLLTTMQLKSLGEGLVRPLGLFVF